MRSLYQLLGKCRSNLYPGGDTGSLSINKESNKKKKNPSETEEKKKVEWEMKLSSEIETATNRGLKICE